jgi:hypothetical protein
MVAELSIEQIAKNKEKLREEIRQKEELFKAYDLVEKDLQRNGQAVIPPEAPITARIRTRAVDQSGYGYKTKAVCKAIDDIGKPFTIKGIQRYLAASGTNLSIESVTTVMNRLRQGLYPKVTVKHPGKGRRATIFEKA